MAPELAGVIKTPEQEKVFRELYEKATGMDQVFRPYIQQISQQHEQLTEQVQGFQADVQELREYYRAGDMDSFFGKLNIPEEKILQWAVEKAQYRQLPPDQQMQIERQRQLERQSKMSERQMDERDSYYMEQLSRSKADALQVMLQQPQVKGFAESFDQRNGAGAFWNAVAEHGEMAWHTRKVDLTPSQAVKEVMARYGSFSQPGAAPQGQQQAQGQTTGPQPSVAQANATPVIPNVAGRQTSPMKQKPKSLDDLRKIANSM